MDQVLTESSTKGSGQDLHYHLNTVQTIQFKGYFTVDLIVVDLWSSTKNVKNYTNDTKKLLRYVQQTLFTYM